MVNFLVIRREELIASESLGYPRSEHESRLRRSRTFVENRNNKHIDLGEFAPHAELIDLDKKKEPSQDQDGSYLISSGKILLDSFYQNNRFVVQNFDYAAAGQKLFGRSIGFYHFYPPVIQGRNNGCVIKKHLKTAFGSGYLHTAYRSGKDHGFRRNDIQDKCFVHDIQD